jgi:hypothetical protein
VHKTYEEKFLCLQISSKMHNLSKRRKVLISSYIHLYIDAPSPHLMLPWTMCFHFYTDRFHQSFLDWHFLLAAGRMFNCKSVGYSKTKCPIVCCFTLLRLSGTQPTTFKWWLNVQGDQKFSAHLTTTVRKIDELKMAITYYIRDVDRAILSTVFENTVRRVNKCLGTGGGHFEHYL